MATPLTQLRNKYADDLEEILQCPVCFENMAGPVPMCLQGHHVCKTCLPQVPNCPFCKSFFNGSRNYLAENLAAKFEEIKTSLIDPKNIINTKIFQNKICVATQTDELEENFEDISNNNDSIKEVDYSIPPPVGKGTYACRIGQCPEQLGHGRIIPHIRYYHKDNLIEEKITNSKTFTHLWELPYRIPNNFNVALNIPHMGIFFLIVSIDDKGDLYGSLQIANSKENSKQFSYCLEILSTDCCTCYKGQVLPNRTFKTEDHQKSLFVNSSYMKHLMKRKNKLFKCQLTIDRTAFIKNKS